jgi:hypothetical protein
MNGEQIDNKNIQPEEHQELNYIVLILIVVILAAAGWYFFLRDGGGEPGKKLTVEEERELIKKGQITLSTENISRVFSTGDLPLSEDAQIISTLFDDEDTTGTALAALSYLTDSSVSEVKNIYLDWALDNSFDTKETKGEKEETMINISENDNPLFDITLVLSRGRTKVILNFIQNSSL